MVEGLKFKATRIIRLIVLGISILLIGCNSKAIKEESVEEGQILKSQYHRIEQHILLNYLAQIFEIDNYYFVDSNQDGMDELLIETSADFGNEEIIGVFEPATKKAGYILCHENEKIELLKTDSDEYVVKISKETEEINEYIYYQWDGTEWIIFAEAKYNEKYQLEEVTIEGVVSDQEAHFDFNSTLLPMENSQEVSERNYRWIEMEVDTEEIQNEYYTQEQNKAIIIEADIDNNGKQEILSISSKKQIEWIDQIVDRNNKQNNDIFEFAEIGEYLTVLFPTEARSKTQIYISTLQFNYIDPEFVQSVEYKNEQLVLNYHDSISYYAYNGEMGMNIFDFVDSEFIGTQVSDLVGRANWKSIIDGVEYEMNLGPQDPYVQLRKEGELIGSAGVFYEINEEQIKVYYDFLTNTETENPTVFEYIASDPAELVSEYIVFLDESIEE